MTTMIVTQCYVINRHRSLWTFNEFMFVEETVVVVVCLSCSCFAMNGRGQTVVMVEMVDMSYFKVSL